MRRKILDMLKTTATDASIQAYGFAMYCCEDPNARREEAIKLAKIMTGQADWQGMRSEWSSYSGLSNLANRWLKASGNNWRIRETIVNGDGTSIYSF